MLLAFRLWSPINSSRTVKQSIVRRVFYSTSTASSAAQEPLRILFCGSDNFSVDALKTLHALHLSNPDIVRSIEVVHKPAKPVGRGLKKLRHVPIQEAATDLKLPTHVLNSFTGWDLPESNINLIVAVSFGLFVPPRILNLVKYGGINVHPSLLPDLRGPAPIHHALLLNRPYTGVTVQTLDSEKFDHGVRLIQSPSITIPNQDSSTPDRLLDQLTPVASSLLVECISKRLFEPPSKDRGWYGKDNDIPFPIEHAPKVTKKMQHIDWETESSDSILHRLRLIGPLWSSFESNGVKKRIVLKSMSKVNDENLLADAVAAVGPEPGTLVNIGSPSFQSPRLCIKTAGGSDKVLSVDNWTVEGNKQNSLDGLNVPLRYIQE